MGDVVDFPNPGDRDAAGQGAGKDRVRARAVSDAAIMAERIRRTDRVRGLLKAESSFSVPDAVRVATNLWDLLEELETGHGMTKARFLALAGKSRGLDSTKHLPRYTLRPNLSEEALAKSKRNLSRKRSTYLHFAEKAAEALRRDPSEVLLGLLAGTSILAAVDGLPEAGALLPEHLPDWAMSLATVLNAIGGGISREADLASHLARIGAFGIVPSEDPDVPVVDPALVGHPPLLVTDGDLWPVDALRDGLLPLYPHILVGEVAAGEAFEVKAQVTLHRHAPVMTTAQAETRIEVRLAVLPFAPSGALGAALLVTAYTDVGPIHAEIEAVNGEMDDALPRSLASSLRSGVKRRRDLLDRGRFTGFLSPNEGRYVFVPPFGNLQLQTDTATPDRVTAVVPNALGDEDEGDIAGQTRVYRLSAETVRRVLGWRISRDVADWVGPENSRAGGFLVTDERLRQERALLERRAQRLGRNPDELAEDEFQEAYADAGYEEEEERRRLFRFEWELSEDTSPSALFAPPSTLASKLERSLLDLPEEERPDVVLLQRARSKVEAVREACAAAEEQHRRGMGVLLTRWLPDRDGGR